jgi:hypothetical protein
LLDKNVLQLVSDMEDETEINPSDASNDRASRDMANNVTNMRANDGTSSGANAGLNALTPLGFL